MTGPARLAEATRAQVATWEWTVDPGSPFVGPPFPSPVVADPTFLPPDRARDGRWHLWAHSLVGLHAWTSDDGRDWRDRRTVTRNALRPHVVDLGDGRPDRYRLAYEKTRLFLPVGLPWRSWLESRRSADLARWGAPTVLLRPSLPWHRDPAHGEAVSNPCLVPDPDGGWRLYYSAGFVLLPDCGFTEPAHIGVARGRTPDGPFEPLPEPLLGPDAGDPAANLGAGAIKVARVADGWLGFQNGITWDPATGHSGSAIRLLGSDDGLAWSPLRPEPILAPSGAGWMSSYVYALDVRDTPDGVVLWFNARDGHHWTRGRERLGRATPAWAV